MSASQPAKAWIVHHVGLTVSDLERSIRFYRDVLGWELVRRRTADADYLGQQTGYTGVRLDVASFKPSAASPQSIELVQYLSHGEQGTPPATNIAGTAHLCFQVDDLPTVQAQLTARGVKFKSPPVAITSGPNRGGYGVYLLDPDGFTIELFQPPPAAAATVSASADELVHAPAPK